DLLKVDEKASEREIEDAFLKLSGRFNPLALEGGALENIADKAREICLAVGRAYGELADPMQRDAVVERRMQKREEHRRGLAAGRFAIKTDLLDPSVQFRKGKALMEAGMHREAIQLLEFAADCDAQNVEYRAELAWCRFLDSSSNARQSSADLKEAMRIDPQNGLAVFYAGEIHRITGNKAESEPLLRKACKMMAPDRRPVEALKLLMTAK
ncbi:MAG: tetratricopeptide repeat protein, partial [Thermoanaerobaculia bacterium]